MILAIDIGNTTVNIGGMELGADGRFHVAFSTKVDTNPVRRSAKYLNEIKAKLAVVAPDATFTGCALVSVVPKAEEPLADCARAITGVEPLRVTWQNCGLQMAVDNPGAVGRDRFVDAAWAAARMPLPAVTVDMGTATTFNVIGEGGVFLGGIIAPGLATGLNALSANAAQLPPVELRTPEKIIGTNTLDCMRSGAVAGAAALIDGLVQSIEEELGRPVHLAITGGTARWAEPLLRHEHLYDPDLLLKGLCVLWQQNS